MSRRLIPSERIEGIADSLVGLTATEAEARLRRFGGNDILERPPGGWRHLALETARDPMLWFLLGTSLLFAFTGDKVEAAVLLVALIPFIGMDAFLHRRTQASTQGLSGRLASTATVVRDGVAAELPATAVVPGDLVLVPTSEPFPADGVIVGGDSLQVDESALTGEAYPARKTAARLTTEEPLDDQHWAFAGTRLLTGKAQVRVIYTGGETLYGEIVRSAISGTQARTPLQIAIAGLVRVLVVAALVGCIILAWVRIAQGHGIVDGLVSAVTLAVAALPEEFPVVFTFFLGVGVYRLAKKQALVRRAVVVENIGRVSTICTDKTGTITEGRLSLTHVEGAEGTSEAEVMRLAALASRKETGDPLDAAILRALPPTPGLPVLATFPFAEDRKRETVVLRENERLLAVTKGAPETILALCTPDGGAAGSWRERVDRFAQSGHKVIAVASRVLEASAWPGGEPDRGFQFGGLIAFEDPVRPGVPEAVAQCRSAGIRVIMVTGDHPGTAAAIAAEIGLGGGRPEVVLAEEFERRVAANADSSRIDVVARAVPSQKLALVRALQRSGEIVAVTGDGVNDVPALQAADIGIAMGERGTRSAREVADIVLLDDNFASLASAIAEGRQLFTNLQLAFQYLLTIHIPLVITAALVPLLGYPLLYLPIHIVWLELIIHPTALLVFQQLPPAGLRHRPPRPGRQAAPFFERLDWIAILAAGLLITAIIMASSVRSFGSSQQAGHARAMALVALVVASGTVTAALSRLRSWPARLIVACTVLSAVLFVQEPRLASWLGLEPLHLDDWAIAAGGGLLAASLSALRWLTVGRAPDRPLGESAR